MIKIAFWGLGSIAKRHIVNLCEILKKRNIEFQIDIIRHSNISIENGAIKSLISNIYNENQLPDIEYDIVFITNPTSMHYKTIKRCVNISKHLFIEKPIFDKCDLDIDILTLKKDTIYYVACPLRYSSVLQYVKQNINLKTVYSVRAISSSYLPEWRQGIDYRDTYSAHKELGGGAAIDLIHEWDYLISLFGFPEQVLYAGGKFSSLEIDSDDLAVYIGIYKDKLVELHLDYFGRESIRKLELFTAENTIVADIANGRVTYKKQNLIIDLKEERNYYQKRELEHFLNMVEGKCENTNSVENALSILKIAKNFKEVE